MIDEARERERFEEYAHVRGSTICKPHNRVEIWFAAKREAEDELESYQLGEATATELAESFHTQLAAEVKLRKAAGILLTEAQAIVHSHAPGFQMWLERCHAWHENIPAEAKETT